MKRNLDELFREYVGDCVYMRKLRPETIRGYRACFKRFQKLMPEITHADMLSQDVISDFFRRLETTTRIVGRDTKRVGVRASTTRTYHSKLNSFFEWLYLKGHITTNPLTHIKPPEVEYNDKRALEKRDAERILTAVLQHSRNTFIMKRDMAMLHVLLFCGLRKGELISLRVRDINLERRTLLVNGNTSKSKKDRLLPINASLLLHMQDYMDERRKWKYASEYLWVSSNRDERLSPHGLKHWVNRLRKLSGVRFHLHQLRHTFACSLGRKGESSIRLQRLLGHSDPRMTERYLRSLTVDDIRDVVDKLSVESLA
jgi:site-specific recombinase XerD